MLHLVDIEEKDMVNKSIDKEVDNNGNWNEQYNKQGNQNPLICTYWDNVGHHVKDCWYCQSDI